MPVGFSKVQIARMALSHVGSKSNIESLDENNTSAKECKLWYDMARLRVLEVHNWGFARKSQALALHSDAAPTYRWSYRYSKPSDCVAPRMIENPLGLDADAIPFDIEEAPNGTESIVTDQASAVLLFTRNIEDVTRFSMHFIHMMSLQLAIFINPKLTGKTSVLDRLQRRFDSAFIQCPAVDAEWRVPRQERDAPWHRDR